MLESKLRAALVFLLVSSACKEAPEVEVAPAEPPAVAPVEEISSLAGVKQAVVTVKLGDQQGSGFVVAPGVVLTNHHVIIEPGRPQRMVTVIFSSPTAHEQASVERVSPELDLATLRCAKEAARCWSTKPVPLGEGTAAEIGDLVHAFGSPAGLEHTLTQGIISSTSRRVGSVAMLQADLAVNAGNSGGPLLDKSARAIGVVSAKMFGLEGIAFAVPIEYALQGNSPVLAGVLETRMAKGPGLRKMEEDSSESAPIAMQAERPQQYRAAPQPREEAPRWSPTPSRSFTIVESTYDYRNIEITFRFVRLTEKRLSAADRFFLVRAPRNYETNGLPLTYDVPAPELLNTIESEREGTITYLLRIRLPSAQVRDIGNLFHVLLNQDEYSEAFTIKHVYRR